MQNCTFEISSIVIRPVNYYNISITHKYKRIFEARAFGFCVSDDKLFLADTGKNVKPVIRIIMHLSKIVLVLCMCVVFSFGQNSIVEVPPEAPTESWTEEGTTETPLGCVCGVFLSGQFKKGSKEQPKGNPALLHEHTEAFPCTPVGNKLCTNKCLDAIVKHLPNSPAILCGSIDRDCHKERAYLFIKNCKDEWINTNLSAGREYCCKDGIPYKCPILS